MCMSTKKYECMTAYTVSVFILTDNRYIHKTHISITRMVFHILMIIFICLWKSDACWLGKLADVAWTAFLFNKKFDLV